MLVTVRLTPPRADEAWLEQTAAALAALQARPGFLRGWVGRSTDDEQAWLLAAEFASAGDCRRAMSAADVRPLLWPLLADATDGQSTYEILVAADAVGGVQRLGSDLAPDHGWVSLGRLPGPGAADLPPQDQE